MTLRSGSLVRQIRLQAGWSLAGFLGGLTSRSFFLRYVFSNDAFRIRFMFREAKWRYQRLAPLLESEHTEQERAAVRRFCAVGARYEWLEAIRTAAVGFTIATVGTFMWGTVALTWLSVHAAPFQFYMIFGYVTFLNFIYAIPRLTTTQEPIRNLLGIMLRWAIVAALTYGTFLGVRKIFGDNSVSQLAAVATVSVLYVLVLDLLATAAGWFLLRFGGYILTQSRMRRYPEYATAFHCLRAVHVIQRYQYWRFSLSRTHYLARQIESAAWLIEQGFPRRARLPSPLAQESYQRICSDSAKALRELQLWAAAKKPDSEEHVSRRLQTAAIAVALGNHDALPTIQSGSETYDRLLPHLSPRRQLLSTARNLAVAFIPFGFVVLVRTLGLPLEGLIGGTTALLAIIWPSIVLISTLDPSYAGKFAAFRELVGALRGSTGAGTGK